MTIFKLTNAEMVNLIAEYQKTGDNVVFNKIYEELAPMARRVATNFYHSGKSGLNHTMLDDYIAEAELAIYKAVMQYDVKAGSPFNSFLKERINWSLQDEFVKKNFTKSEQLNSFASINSIDREYQTDEDSVSYGEMIMFNNALVTDADEVFTAVVDRVEKSPDLIDTVLNLINEFYEIASTDDSNIIKLVLEAIQTQEKTSAKFVNQSLAMAYPDVKLPTLKKRKSRAIGRFTDFAKEKGFVLDLSHF